MGWGEEVDMTSCRKDQEGVQQQEELDLGVLLRLSVWA